MLGKYWLLSGGMSVKQRESGRHYCFQWPLHTGRGRDKQVCITEEGLEVDSDLVDVLKLELTVDYAVVGILALSD